MLGRKDANKLFEEGIRMLKSGNFDEGFRKLEQSAELDPSFEADVYRNKAIIYGRLKDYEKSLNYCQKALELDPNYDEVWYQMGMCHFRFYEFEKAFDCYERAKQLGCSRGGLEHNIRACKLQMGR